MSSLKMTFSLTSLIFLIALGLVFAPTSVMAHTATEANTDTAGDATLIHALGTAADHTHPVVEVILVDADPNTGGTQIVDKDADTEADDLNATIEFDVTLRLPLGAQSGGSAVSAITATIVPYGRNFLPVGTLGTITFAQGTLADDGTFTAGTAATDRDFQAPVVLTIVGAAVPTTLSGADLTAANTASRKKAIADAIADVLMVDITVAANAIQTTGLVGGTMAGQGNLESKNNGHCDTNGSYKGTSDPYYCHGLYLKRQ